MKNVRVPWEMEANCPRYLKCILIASMSAYTKIISVLMTEKYFWHSQHLGSFLWIGNTKTIERFPKNCWARAQPHQRLMGWGFQAVLLSLQRVSHGKMFTQYYLSSLWRNKWQFLFFFQIAVFKQNIWVR